MDLLRKLIADIDAVVLNGDEFVAGYKADTGDDPGNPARILPDQLKRHFVVLDTARKSLHELHERRQNELFAMDHDSPDFVATKKQFQTEIDFETSRYKDNERLFWGSVRRTFPDIFDAKEIGLRAGWQVVIVNKKSNPRCEVCPYRGDCTHVGQPGLDVSRFSFGPPMMVRGSDLSAFLASLDGDAMGSDGGFEDMFAEMFGVGGSRRR